MRWIGFLATLVLSGGCAAPNAGSAAPQAGGSSAQAGGSASQARTAGPNSADASRPSADAVANPIKVYHLDWYLLRVPRGTVADNDAFWKRIDEDCVDFQTRQQLNRNGLRVGRAHVRELEAIRDHLETAEGDKTRLTGVRAQDLEIVLQSRIARQTIWYFDRRGELVGLDTPRVDNLVYLSYRTTPRKPDSLRVSLAPAVRNNTEQFKVEELPDGQRNVSIERPETLYDCGLTVDVPMDHFAVVSAGPSATDYRSVGRLFFIEDAPAEQLERVIVLVPSVRSMVEVPK
jgi:hypothetical protein